MKLVAVIGHAVSPGALVMTRLKSFVFAQSALAAAAYGSPHITMPPTPVFRLSDVPFLGAGRKEKLDLYFPSGDFRSNRPAVVFIHGGGFVVGSKDAAVHNGSAFARSGVVCVAINYRMGIDGFLPVPGVPTNLGLRDILFALAWVQRNVAAFGGDPANVTVFGESAGAMAIGASVSQDEKVQPTAFQLQTKRP